MYSKKPNTELMLDTPQPAAGQFISLERLKN